MAADLKASDAYVRRLLIRQRIYGVKIGQVWAVYKEDLESFKRLRRPPGRPSKAVVSAGGEHDIRRRITEERADAQTDGLLRQARQKRQRTPAKRQQPR